MVAKCPAPAKEVTPHSAELLISWGVTVQSCCQSTAGPGPSPCSPPQLPLLRQQDHSAAQQQQKEAVRVGGERFPKGCGKRGRILVHVSEKIFAFVVQNGARGSFKALQLCCFVSFPFGAAFFLLLAFARGEQMEWGARCCSAGILLEGHAWGFMQVTLPGTFGMRYVTCCVGPVAKLWHRGAVGPGGAIASTQGFSFPWLSGDLALCLGGSCLKNHNQKSSGSWFTVTLEPEMTQTHSKAGLQEKSVQYEK